MSLEELSTSLLNFSIDVYKILVEKSQNTFFSPLSLYTALAMTSLGAKENTLEELKKILYIQDGSHDDFHSSLGNIIQKFNEPTHVYILQIANHLFIQDGLQINADYLASTSQYYNGGISTKDFLNNAEAARIDINMWVEKQTQNKIKDLLKPGIIDSMTRLVLVNALYFKGNWMNQFKVANTLKKPFYINEKETKEVDMMFRKGNYKFIYSENLKSKLLELPYLEQQLSMVLVLPDAIESLTELENRISAEVLKTEILAMFKSEVEVQIPKFQLEEQYSLVDKLSQLGLVDLFNEKSDLSGVFGKAGELIVGAVEHKAFIEVNEEGSEAAAATAIKIGRRCVMICPEFTANHPFLFLIRDNLSGLIIFMGSLRNPV